MKKSLTTSKTRVVVIGLDSCDPDLVQLWSKEGRLPFLSSLMKKGIWARLISTRGLFSDAPWPSFNTGYSPGKHGFYNFLRIKRGTTEIIRTNAYNIPILPFWSHLKNSGKKVAIFDVPKTYPIDGLTGAQIASWGEHYPLIETTSLPAGIAEEFNHRFGKYSHPAEVIDPSVSREVKLYQKMMRNTEKRLNATRFLMEQEDWDLFISVFAETHYGGHQLYHHSDPKHWAYDSDKANMLGDSLIKIYERTDQALSEILSSLPEDVTIFVLSVHGISTNYSANYLMTEVLQKLGFQVPQNTAQTNDSTQGKILEKIRDLVPMSWRDFVNEKVLPQPLQDRLISKFFSNSIDWQRSKAFFLPSDHFQGFISVNLMGREPAGTVRPGTEYEEICMEIRNELMQLINADTGRPAIQQVSQVSKVYEGKSLLELPDLVIQWAKDTYIRRLYHPKTGAIKNDGIKVRKNQHTSDGFMVALGKHINVNAVLDQPTTMDLAPTILHLLGHSVPEDMDGNVLHSLLQLDREPV